MAKTGSQIEGWWVWFQGGWGDTARRFKTREDALEWTPNLKGQGYLGKRVVMRVAFAPGGESIDAPWSHDPPELFDGPETEAEARKRIVEGLKKK